MKIKLNALNNSIAQALKTTTLEIASAATIAMETERWDWNNQTTRSDGTVVGTPRDIVDTGELKDSQTVSVGQDKATIKYTADYAAIVHRDRPWLATALEETDVIKTFTAQLKKDLS